MNKSEEKHLESDLNKLEFTNNLSELITTLESDPSTISIANAFTKAFEDFQETKSISDLKNHSTFTRFYVEAIEKGNKEVTKFIVILIKLIHAQKKIDYISRHLNNHDIFSKIPGVDGLL